MEEQTTKRIESTNGAAPSASGDERRTMKGTLVGSSFGCGWDAVDELGFGRRYLLCLRTVSRSIRMGTTTMKKRKKTLNQNQNKNSKNINARRTTKKPKLGTISTSTIESKRKRRTTLTTTNVFRKTTTLVPSVWTFFEEKDKDKTGKMLHRR